MGDFNQLKLRFFVGSVDVFDSWIVCCGGNSDGWWVTSNEEEAGYQKNRDLDKQHTPTTKFTYKQANTYR